MAVKFSPHKSISIKEIAELAGVSVATVSRVLNKNGYVSSTTEERVQAVIDENGYVPNMVARGLRTKSSPIIGVIIPDISNEFFSNYVFKIQERLFAHNYFSVFCSTNESLTLERSYLKLLRAQNISGLIYVAGDTFSEYTVKDIPTVFIDRLPNDKIQHKGIYIHADNEQGGNLAAHELVDAGCHHIAILTDMSRISSHIARYNGFRSALQDAGISLSPSLILRAEKINFLEGHHLTSRLIESGESFDGIFCTADTMALGAVTSLQQHGIRVPAKVKVVGYDDISIAQHSANPFTTIHQPIDEMAGLAVELLMKMIAGEEIEKNTYKYPVRLIRRSTT